MVITTIKPLALVAVKFVLVFFLIAPCIGADEPAVRKDRTYQKALDQLLADPANPENSFQFARQAIRAGDLQGAITAFERILKINPGLDNIKLELGVLYLRVGASELADKYTGEALQSPHIPLPVKNRAKAIQKRAQQASSPHNFSFRTGIGTQYDDNATFAPSSREVLVSGQPAFLDEESTGESDSAVLFTASAQYVYNFNSQIGNQLESGFSWSSRNYNKSSEIDSEYAALQIGPRFYFGEVLNPAWSFKPFIQVSQLTLDGDDYQDSTAVGIDLSKIFTVTQMLSLQMLYRDNDFSNSDIRTTVSQRSGNEWNLGLRYSRLLRPALRGFIAINAADRDAEVDFEQRQTWGAATGIVKSYRAPFGLQQRWNSSLTLSWSDIDYDSPDPAIDPDQARAEERSQISWHNNLVFTNRLYTTVSIYHTDNESSLPNFEYDNTGVSVTLWASF